MDLVLKSDRETNRQVGVGTKMAAVNVMIRSALMLLAALLSILGIGCQNPPSGAQSEKMIIEAPDALTAGDVIKLTFPGASELTQTQKIRPDGKVSLPLIGEIDAAGKKLGKFQDELSLRYKPQLHNSEVIVTLESSSTPVVLSGAVSRPGKIVFDQPTTLLEAIMEAGGIAQFGNPRKIYIIRVENGEHRTQIIDLSPALQGRPMPVFYVKGGDVIYVPERAVNF